ncbi:MAG: cytochrome c [Chloroflexi bacterium]|nr:cytochrome c [Chloroflexota bacterium]
MLKCARSSRSTALLEAPAAGRGLLMSRDGLHEENTPTQRRLGSVTSLAIAAVSLCVLLVVAFLLFQGNGTPPIPQASPSKPPASAGAGPRLYASYCSSCHGTGVDAIGSAPDVEKLLSEGRSAKGMPGLAGVLDPGEIKTLAGYVVARTTSTARGDAKESDGRDLEARRLYANACAACHGSKGDLLSDVNLGARAYWQKADEMGLAKAVVDGKGGMPPMGKDRGGILSDGQVMSIIWFLKDRAAIAQRTTLRITPTPGAISPPGPAQPKPQPSGSSGSSNHSPDWLSKHSRDVMANGAGSCYKCHGTRYCVDCHVRR